MLITDNKGAGEGPYTFSSGIFHGPNGFTFKVEWNNGFDLDSATLTKEIVKVANIAYSEGRKSMEKDFTELLHIANKWSEFPLDSSNVTRQRTRRFISSSLWKKKYPLKICRRLLMQTRN